MKKFIVEGYIDVPEEDLADVLLELPIHISLTRQEEGCLEFSVTQDTLNKSRFMVYEVFLSQAAFDFHQKRTQASRWGFVARNAKRHYQIFPC